MSTDSPTPQNQASEVVKPRMNLRMYWVIGVFVLLIGAAVFYFNRGSDKNVPEAPKKQQPLYHRDEPAEKQIFQDDYKAKVRELLDSGKSVMEISKETHIRIDEVRKIKKEYKKSKEGQ